MKTIEISIKEIIVYVLRRWMLVGLIALLCAVAMGVVAYEKAPKTPPMPTPVPAEEARMSPEQEAELQLAKEKLAALEEYANENPLLSINSYHAEMSVVTLHAGVKTAADDALLQKSAEKRSFSAARVLTGLYYALAKEADYEEVFANAAPGCVVQQLREVFTVEMMEDALVLRAYGTSRFGAKSMTDAMVAYLNSRYDAVAKAGGKHTLQVLDSSLYYDSDTKLAARQAEARENIQKVRKQLTDDVRVLSHTPDPVEIISVSKRAIAKKAAFGGVIGVVLGVLCAVVLYAVKLSLQLPEQLQKQLGVHYIGGVKRRKTSGGLPGLIAGGMRLGDEGFAAAVTAERVKAIGTGIVLLTGSLPDKDTAAFASKVQKELGDTGIRVMHGGSLNQSADTVRQLSACDAVVLAERLDKSTMREINEEIDRVAIAGKKLLGYVLY